jgi:large subunit ribosomal protein L4
MELSVFNIEGKQEAEKLSVNDTVFAGKINRGLLHLAVLWHLAKRRSGSANTKTKSEVRGGGRKPYQQKHTGNARRGSSRSPLIVGGGVAFGPKPRSYEFKLTKKMKKAALCSALSNKKQNLIVLKDIEIKAPKTKEVARILANFKVQESSLFIDDSPAEKFFLASRNLPKVKTVDVKSISVYELMKFHKLFITKKAVKKLEEILA